MRVRRIVPSVLALAMLVPVVARSATPQGPPLLLAATGSARFAATPPEVLDLSRCLRLAVDAGNRRKVADAEVDAATARLGQARSSRYPEVSASLSGVRLNENPNFIFPGMTISTPASTIDTGIPGMAIPIPGQNFQMADWDVKLMDRTLFTGSLSATYALYTGGLASARMAQARAGLDVAREERRLTDAEVAFDVQRAYYGVILAGKLLDVARGTLDRMDATLELTKSIYEAGTGRVKKTDFLRHRAMVETIRGMVIELEAQDGEARLSLATIIGWDREKPFALADSDFPAPSEVAGTARLLADAVSANPRLAMIRSALLAAASDVKAAQAGHLPKVALFADVKRFGNDYSAGLMTADNKTAWSVGLGVDVPLFQGFRVVKAVDEARARRVKLERQLDLASDGVELDIRRTRLAIEKAAARQRATREAYATATENRELNIRAYQEELVETQDMIEAQLMEDLLAAQHFRAQYELTAAMARLEMILAPRLTDGNQHR
jgi:outer membrane protein